MAYDDNYYRNCVLCGVKVALSISPNIFDGRVLLIDSSIPTFQKLGTSLAMITAIAVGLLADTSEMSNDEVWLPLQLGQLAKRLGHKLSQIKPMQLHDRQALDLRLAALFAGKQNTLCFEARLDVGGPPEGDCLSDFARLAVRELPTAPALLYMETVPGASKIKENINKLKTILEFRLFLKAIGYQEFSKCKTISEVMRTMATSLDDLRIALKEKFDDRSYTKASVEETMNVECIELVSDIAYASQTLESIFAVNPYQ